MGHLFRRSYKDKETGDVKHTATWSYRFHLHGKPVDYATGETNKNKAKDKGREHELELKRGSNPSQAGKVTFNDLQELLLSDYRVNKKASLDRAERSVNNLKPYFAGYKASEITPTEVKRYIQKRQKEKAANATINRELAALKRMFRLAVQDNTLSKAPYIPSLTEDNVRTGFFEHADYEALRAKLPPHVQGVVTLAYMRPMRVQEVLALKKNQVDFTNHVLRLEVGSTKNKEGRIIPLDPLLEDMLKEHISSDSDWVFRNIDGTDRIRDFRFAWEIACEKAKIGKRLFHDFRRTAARNLVRAGVSENVVMKMGGWKTASVFRRYDIVVEADLHDAGEKLTQYLIKQASEQPVAPPPSTPKPETASKP